MNISIIKITSEESVEMHWRDNWSEVMLFQDEEK